MGWPHGILQDTSNATMQALPLLLHPARLAGLAPRFALRARGAAAKRAPRFALRACGAAARLALAPGRLVPRLGLELATP